MRPHKKKTEEAGLGGAKFWMLCIRFLRLDVGHTEVCRTFRSRAYLVWFSIWVVWAVERAHREHLPSSFDATFWLKKGAVISCTILSNHQQTTDTCWMKTDRGCWDFWVQPQQRLLPCCKAACRAGRQRSTATSRWLQLRASDLHEWNLSDRQSWSLEWTRRHPPLKSVNNI